MNSFCQWNINIKATHTCTYRTVSCGKIFDAIESLGLSWLQTRFELPSSRKFEFRWFSPSRSSKTFLPWIFVGACLSRSWWKWLAPECVPSTAAMQNCFHWASTRAPWRFKKTNPPRRHVIRNGNLERLGYCSKHCQSKSVTENVLKNFGVRKIPL